MAAIADRHALYEASVQDVEVDQQFISETFKELRGHRARFLREDFCGTAKMCCEWVRQHPKNTAAGVDIDPEVLSWGRNNNLAKLKKNQRKRIKLIEKDVLKAKTKKAEIIVAMNFSYQLLTTRKHMTKYFKSVLKSLDDEGVFFLDAFGGYEAYKETREKRKLKGFTYIWEQEHYNPITGDITCHIHFKFKDKTCLNKAFTYEWRMWTLPELRELLEESGFSTVNVYWEGTDEESGEGDGMYSPTLKGDADPCWVCYVIAEK